MKNHAEELPEECRLLRLAVFECKRSMVRTEGAPACPEFTAYLLAGYAQEVQRKWGEGI